MYKFTNLTKKNIKKFKQLHNLKENFNLVNKDFFQNYNNANFMQQLLLRRKVKLLEKDCRYLGYIWIENIKQEIYNIPSMYVIENSNIILEYKKLLELCNSRAIFNYTCMKNNYNFKVLKELGFKEKQGALVMFLNLEEYERVDLSDKGIKFTEVKIGKEEKQRCYIQNEVFKTKERIPLRVEDVLYDEMQEYYLKEGALFVKRDQEYIGYGQIILQSKMPYLVNIGILPEYRNNGYGKLLLYALLNKLKSTSYSKVFLKVDVKNKVAIDLYKKLGFKAKSKLYNWQLKT